MIDPYLCSEVLRKPKNLTIQIGKHFTVIQLSNPDESQ